MLIIDSVICMSGDGATAGCSYSKGNFDNDNISSRKKDCLKKPLKCLERSAVFDEENLTESE